MFAAAQLLPGNIGRNVLGPFASPQDVIKYNHEHGVDRSNRGLPRIGNEGENVPRLETMDVVEHPRQPSQRPIRRNRGRRQSGGDTPDSPDKPA